MNHLGPAHPGGNGPAFRALAGRRRASWLGWCWAPGRGEFPVTEG